MGLYCSAIHVRHHSPDEVAGVLGNLVRERALVSNGLHGWISVYDATAERDIKEGKRLAAQLGKGLRALVLLLDLYDDAVTRYALFNSGKEIDEFDSCPDYFHPVTSATSHRGDAKRLQRYGKVGKNLGLYRSLLEQRDPASLAEEDRLRGLARAYGIATARAVLAYSSISASRAKRMIVVDAAPDEAAITGLGAAARAGDIAAVRALLRRGVPVDAVDAQGATPLQRAVEGGHLPVLRALLSRPLGRAPLSDALFWAAVRQDVRATQALLAAGADPNGRDDGGASPLFRAVYHPKAEPDVARLLVKSGAQSTDTLMVRHIGAAPRATTALHAAATVAPVEVVQVLASVAKTKDVKDATGRTPLMIATEHGRADVVAALTNGRTGTRPK
jgi:hypothetical protein